VISMLADEAVTRSVVIESGALASSKPGLIHLSDLAALEVRAIKRSGQL
jgi:hypothetical protein